MNASERLQAIIKERQEWEAFGWGPLLTLWAVVLVVKAVVELWTGPRAEVGFAAYFVALVGQAVLAALPGARSGARQPQMHGLWALAAVTAWFFGSWAPQSGLLEVAAAAVIELLFLAGALVMTGILKARRSLFIGGASLAVGAVVMAVFPALWPWRAVLIASTFGSAAVTTLIADRSSARQKSQQ